MWTHGTSASGQMSRQPGFMYIDYNLPVQKMTNTDLSRILRSEEIHKALPPPNLPMHEMTNTDLSRILSEEIQKAPHTLNKKIDQRAEGPPASQPGSKED